MKSFVVIYRTGGTLNFKWHRTLPVSNPDVARQQRADVERMGYPAFIEDYDQSMAIGLPETFDAPTPLEERA